MKLSIALFVLAILLSPSANTQATEYQITHDPQWAEHPSWSPDGSMVVFESFRGSNRNIWIIPDTGGEATQITTHSAEDFQPDWSPDGDQLVFWSDRGGNANLWLYTLETESLTQLTYHTGADYYPKWSHDGSQIAFVSNRSGTSDIWTIPSSGGIATQITDDSYDNWAPTWSPDGSEIAFVSERTTNGDIFRVPVTGGPLVQITADGGGAPSWSANNVIAFHMQGGDGNVDIYTINPDGSDLTRITSHPDSDFNCEWSADCSKIVFTSTRSGTDDIWAVVVEQFTRVTEGPHVNDGRSTWCVNWIDYDNDGYLDLSVTNLFSDDFLYHNEGDGTFTEVTGVPFTVRIGNTNSAGATWGDIDNNGYPDYFLATFEEGNPPVNRAFLNNGNGSFTEITGSAIVADPSLSISPSWVDCDNDGRLDLYVANHSGSNFWYRQQDTGFVRVTEGAIATWVAESNGAAWGDYDGDGYQDLFVANAWDDPRNGLYHNDGSGEFNRVMTGNVVEAQNTSWGGSWGDFDNDGDLDILVTNCEWSTPSTSYDSLFVNNGDGTFSSASSLVPCNHGAYSFGSAWGDYDNDGDLDLFVAVDGTDLLYENLGNGDFALVTETVISSGSEDGGGGAWGDYDRDGDLDLVVGNGRNANNALYRNNGNGNNWINIKCVGVTSNRSAIGARVRLKAAIAGNPVWQMREINSKSGKNGQSSLNAHFGLGDATMIDSLRIEWPSGIIQTQTDVPVNQFMVIEENCCGLYNEGYTGNANCSTDGKVTLSDITRLIDFVYVSKAPLCCERNGNANGSPDAKITLSDITRLIDHVYITKQQTAECL